MRTCFIIGCMCGTALANLPGLMAAGLAERPRVTSVVRADPRTGRLVRSFVRSSVPGVVPGAQQPKRTAVSGQLAQTVDRIARQNQVSPQLIHSVIRVESNYDPYAVSPKGALGLMQLIPSTARRFGVSDVFDPADNIQGGARYLKYLLELYKGDKALALAAYNAGEGAVSHYGGIPPFPRSRTIRVTPGSVSATRTRFTSLSLTSAEYARRPSMRGRDLRISKNTRSGSWARWERYSNSPLTAITTRVASLSDQQRTADTCRISAPAACAAEAASSANIQVGDFIERRFIDCQCET